MFSCAGVAIQEVRARVVFRRNLNALRARSPFSAGHLDSVIWGSVSSNSEHREWCREVVSNLRSTG